MKVKGETIARTVILVLVLLNDVLAVMGWTPLDISEDTIYQVSTSVTTVVVAIWAWWKNNSYTREAIVADMRLKEMKEY